MTQQGEEESFRARRSVGRREEGGRAGWRLTAGRWPVSQLCGGPHGSPITPECKSTPHPQMCLCACPSTRPQGHVCAHTHMHAKSPPVAHGYAGVEQRSCVITVCAQGLHETPDVELLYLLAASHSLWHLLFQTGTTSKAGEMPPVRCSPRPT